MAELTNIFPTSAVIYALLGGILPALFWLWFWVQEDKLNPEPRAHLFLVFIGGMIAVPLVYPLQKYAFGFFGLSSSTFFIWATIEEMAKYIVVALLVLYTVDYDEPVDALVYLITAALGFAAIENVLFILNPLLEGDVFKGIMATNMRFIGASMLHVICSATLGYFIATAFYRGLVAKMLARVTGLCLAIGLHTVFNLFIIGDKNGSRTFLAFSVVWMIALVILILFEKIKKTQAHN
jgi:RsiW-degrading membrane proteinase PrsW (M82 family)